MKNDNSTTPLLVIILLGIALLCQGIVLGDLKLQVNSLEEQVEVLRERQDIYEIYL